MTTADFLVIGGGVAGLSAAATLAPHGRVAVIEAEAALGTHSSSRSATFAHLGIGNAVVRALTTHSRDFFERPPAGFSEAPLARRTAALFVATEAMLPALDSLEREMARFSAAPRRADAAERRALCPVLSEDIVASIVDETGLRLDPHALLGGYARTIRARGGAIATGHRIATLTRTGGTWQATSEAGERWCAPVVINAAGAWADQVATLAGVRPLGLTPLRRTIILFDPPAGADVRRWPFVKTAADLFYMLPEAGRLIASPVDEVPSAPCDAQPEEYDIALAAARVETFTTLRVPRIAHRWAGLRTFATDRTPVAGFAADAPGFFWLAGQGGFGLQTAPAMALIVEALVTGAAWPLALTTLGVHPDDVSPQRPGITEHLRGP